VALNYYKQAVVIAPRYCQAYYQIGNYLARLGLYAEAIEKYQQTIPVNPASPEPREKIDQLISLQENGKNDARSGPSQHLF
jgi:tetratricopeptide (TPR) repeat protein